MPNPPPPLTPNFNPGVGRLATDRYDFEAHIEGTNFRHHADQIDLFPTLVIDGYVSTNVQQALQNIAGALTAPVIQDASATQKGLIQLAGDLAGLNSTAALPRVGGIQGYPISTLAPTSGQVLTWNGTSWGPTTLSGVFSAGGDLAGTASSQQVIGLTGTGSSPNKTVTAANDVIQFITSATPYITQAYASGANGTKTVLKAQGVSSGTGNGGALVLAGGKSNGSAFLGGVSLAMGGDPATGDAGQYVVQAVEVVTNQRVAAFFPPNETTGLTSTDMPANTGDEVIFIGNADTVPTAAPGGAAGAILYAQGGRLNIMQGNGFSFIIEPTGAKAYFGTGMDGTLTFDGTSTVLGISPSAAHVYQLNRNINAATMTINSGVTLVTNGFKIYCTGTLTVNGTIDNSGANAAGSTQGTGAIWSFMGGGSDGGSGLHFSSAQSGVNFASSNLGLGGQGGMGGNPSNVGGSLNNPDPTAFNPLIMPIDTLVSSTLSSSASAIAAPVVTIFGGGSGGGGGGSPLGGPAVDGGGGGGGGGIVFLSVNTLAGGGSGIVQANGGTGASGSGPSFWAGGGGGGGGVIVVIYGDRSGYSGIFLPAPGMPGIGPNGAGMPGMPGFVVLCQG